MKTYVKILAAMVFLTFASSAWAQSNSISLNYNGGGNFEIDLLTNYYGNIEVYQDGDLVFMCDTGGVLYAASGVTWSENGTDFEVYDLPSGDYTAVLNGGNGGSYSTSTDTINWYGYGSEYAVVQFFY